MKLELTSPCIQWTGNTPLMRVFTKMVSTNVISANVATHVVSLNVVSIDVVSANVVSTNKVSTNIIFLFCSEDHPTNRRVLMQAVNSGVYVNFFNGDSNNPSIFLQFPAYVPIAN